MFPLTTALKEFAIANLGCSKSSSDSDFRKAIALSLAGSGPHKGKITPSQLKSLAAQADAPVKKKKAAPASTGMSQEQIDEIVSKSVEAALKKHGVSKSDASDLTPAALFGGSGSHNIRIKSVADRYSTTTTKAFYPETSGSGDLVRKHALAGRPAEYDFRQLDHPSDLAKAVSGAYYKWAVSKSAGIGEIPRHLKMTDHDYDLINYAARELPWTGIIKGSYAGEVAVDGQRLTELQYKSILDDTISGGLEAAPVVFDDALILYPVLYGELFPFVNVINVSQGRRMKGAAMNNPTITSGVAEGTAITPFSTSGFISAFDTPIYPSVGAVLLGMDFEEDTPIGFGARITQQWGLVMQQQLDKYIAVGDGVSQPLGIMNTASPRSINSENGPGGKLTIGDLEALMFALEKQYRFEAGAMTAYLGNDLSYRRFRKIPVGPGDERRVQGMDYGSYTAIDRPFKIQNDVDDGAVAYVNLKRYRMYRRLGMTIRVVTEGQHLALTNQRLIVVRMRFGGQMETGNAVSLFTDGWQ